MPVTTFLGPKPPLSKDYSVYIHNIAYRGIIDIV